MTPEKAQAKLNQLSGDVNAAVEHYRAARERAAKPWDAVKEVVQPLAAYHSAVTYRQRAPDPAEERRLTLVLFQHIEDDGLALEPLDPTRPAAGFRIVDPRLALQVVATEAAARRAAQARNAFAKKHAALLQEHREQQQMTRIKDALAGDDPTAVRDALAGIDPAPATPPTALRTDDLALAR